jgi:hypothetical protein
MSEGGNLGGRWDMEGRRGTGDGGRGMRDERRRVLT